MIDIINRMLVLAVVVLLTACMALGMKSKSDSKKIKSYYSDLENLKIRVEMLEMAIRCLVSELNKKERKGQIKSDD